MTTARDIMTADATCADENDTLVDAARKMRDRESIAPDHWARVIAASEAKGIPGITYEWLATRRIQGEAA